MGVELDMIPVLEELLIPAIVLVTLVGSIVDNTAAADEVSSKKMKYIHKDEACIQ